MMKITILAAGKLKEHYLVEAAGEYVKRLNRYAHLTMIEIKDEKIKQHDLIDRILEVEAERFFGHITENAYVICMDIDGKRLNSMQFAQMLGESQQWSQKELFFVIGGAHGLSPKLLKRADLRLSFSAMTFPHALFRVMLLEQIYRGFRILLGAPYHK